MAKVLESVQGMDIEIDLPRLFSKMKLSIDGREVGVGVKSKGVHTCSVHQDGAEIVVTLKQRTIPVGFDLSIARNGEVVVSKAIELSGKEMDSRLADIPKWMFTFPILAGAPIFLHGLIPSGIGAIGAAICYKIVANYKDDRRKLFVFSITTIVVTYALILALVGGFYRGLLQMGWLAHNEDYLRETVKQTNAGFPLKVDQVTTATYASYQKDTLILHFTIESVDLENFDSETFLANLTIPVKAQACTDPEVKLMLKNDYWLRYDYTSGPVALGSVRVSKADCR